ncbi:HlyD family type I secretion periplasmic adaptor subunit [Amylibacter sp. IMCC11727]|uniref:HlyD family type I secretion periplasmic adaptor subunit n=1 Tax=Amylibacter sp. IMCC11727 TaxID=3039851 RepID=UPI00244DDF29|nr:HlyD family type I secretion periplasmic adaptor subunit [Amylibacter sp. IMCC11727]WGI21775.1 HlyD family type I secretion periplasmic adaptor subunit [Amylibacter sp. IMCC11727]
MSQQTAPQSKAPERVRWSAKKPMVFGMLAVVLLFSVLGVWGNFATISGAIISSGMIQVESLRQVVQHPQGGVVGTIDVKEGDRVQAGQVLIRFDDTLLRSQLTTVDNQLKEIIARRARLEAERDDADSLIFAPELVEAAKTDVATRQLMQGQTRLFEARRETLRQQIKQLTERKQQIRLQIRGVKAQLASSSVQVELIGKELKDQQGLLEKGLAQASRVLSLQREAARLNGTIGELESSAARGEAQIIETDIQILQLSGTRREEAITTLRDLTYTEIEMVERKLSLEETLARMDVRAPMSGVVHGLTVHALRSVVRPADPILYVVPTDSPLVISSRIEAIHVDQVHVGQDASLRFSTFDQRTTPEIFGKVVKVSADVFQDEVSGISYYSAEIEPNEGEMERLGDVELLPGMPVEAFIKTADRSPLSYLTKPFTDYFNRAFRES